MNWKYLRHLLYPWIDTRAHFISKLKKHGKLLDIGSSEGETLKHFYELRPDLFYFSTDIEIDLDNYPKGTQFYQGDIQKNRLPWNDETLDGISCMHLIEHLDDFTLLIHESYRLLRPSGLIYFETPHPKTVTFNSPPNKYAASFTINFYDDVTHTQPVSIGRLARSLESVGFHIEKTGISRNWLFALSYPVYFFLRPSRQKYTAKVHWLGWSAYLIAKKPL